ncbi:MAG: CDGSH iron-sulfur domain-containing protein [Myxococcales bacterium]|jgi:CDGSH-type Zn-finger protein|nr:CDGSH iron-sulfur domain-containing protein [Myxococcales bacterium]
MNEQQTMDAQEVYIRIMKDGPYLVHGQAEIRQEFIVPNDQGNSWEYRVGRDFTDKTKALVSLCRCGRTTHAPFCDAMHLKVAFDGTERASHTPILDDAKQYPGPNYILLDNEAYCAFARFCDAFGQVWNLVSEGDELTDELTLRETFHCPSGRLMLRKRGEQELLEPKLTPSIGVLEDPAIHVSGPLYVKGGIRVESSDGTSYEIRNRQTLCRCGMSLNKPFCNGAHAPTKYRDGIPEK